MKFGSLFAGIGGIDLGLERAGWSALWQVEINAFCRAVLAKHWPDVRRFIDVHFVSAAQLEPVDAIVAGFPCQDLSPANPHGKGLAGHRSGLWRECRRIIGEVRPRLVILENTFAGWRRWVPHVRAELARIGYRSLPFRLRASDFGALHERSRCFVVADTSGVAVRALSQELRRGLPAASPDADPHGELQPEGRQQTQRRRPGDGVRWSAEPDVARVVHGLPGKLDRRSRRAREEALGNAVCPHLAQWIGEVISNYQNGKSSDEGRNT